jgi:hypothetical protein
MVAVVRRGPYLAQKRKRCLNLLTADLIPGKHLEERGLGDGTPDKCTDAKSTCRYNHENQCSDSCHLRVPFGIHNFVGRALSNAWVLLSMFKTGLIGESAHVIVPPDGRQFTRLRLHTIGAVRETLNFLRFGPMLAPKLENTHAASLL